MKLTVLTWCLLVPYLLFGQSTTHDATRIAREVDALPRGDTGSAQLTIRIKSGGRERQRVLDVFLRETPQVNSSMFFVTEPANLSGSSYLVERERAGGSSSIWLYLPVLKQPRRLGGGDERKPFLSSDLSYADLSKFSWSEDYQLKWLKSQQLDGKEVQLIEAIPHADEAERTGYSKAVLYVDDSIHFVVRAAFWMEKRIKYIQFSDIAKVDGVLTARRIKVAVREGDKVVSETQVEFANQRFNQKLAVEFTPYQLSNKPQ